jgi:DinB superfamily
MPHRVRQAADWFATPHLLDEDRSSTSMNRDLIESFAAGGDMLRRAVHGLSRDDLVARPGPGDWSIQELVIHLADSDEIAIDRMKRIVTEDNPALLYADESAYIARLVPHEQSLDDALTLFEVGRRQWSRVLRRLPDEAFARTGTHNRRGVVILGEMVNGYTKHLEHHLVFLKAKRERLGKPISS